MKNLFRRTLSLLLVLVMAASMLPVVYAQETAESPSEPVVLTDEDYASIDDLFAQIDAMEEAPATKNASETELADEAAALVMASDSYVEGSLERNGNSFTWWTTEGIRCVYSPRMRQIEKDMVAPENPIADGAYNEPVVTKGGWPSGNQVYLIAPYYGYDDSFTDQYKNEATSIATAIGDTDGYTLYSGTAATIDKVAEAMGNGAVVIFDSHGSTDYENGSDYVTGANYSYLCMKSTSGLTTEDYNDGALYYSDGIWITGASIANHMTKNSPSGLLWMAICLGMATDTFATPMREMGVEVVYGYSQSVTFAGDYLYEETFWDCMCAGDNVATAISTMKSKWGEWDWSTKIATEYGYTDGYSTIAAARADYAAFPIVVSDEDTHPGQRSGTSNYGADSLQTVKSTYTLYSQYNVTAQSNNTAYGTVSISGNTITATPATGYFAQSATVLSGTATVNQNGNTFSVIAQSDCTVQINFAAKTPVTVSFSGATVASQSGYAGDSMTLPTATAPEGYKFLGWMTSPLNTDTTEKPSFLTGSFTPTGDTTLYALYSYVDANSGTGTGDYVKVTESRDDWSGEYVIVYEGGGYILDSTLATVDASGNYKTVTITDSTIAAADADAYKVTIAAMDGGYSIKLANGQYMGGTSGSNTLVTGSSELLNTISIDASGNANIISNTSYLRYNTSGTRFRYYKSTSYSSQAAIALYLKDGTGGTTYFTGTPYVCEHTNTQNVAAVAATCTESGYTAGVQCTDCNSYISGHEVVDALGHSWSSWTVTTEPGCETAGEQTRTCSACGATETQSVATTGHSYNAVVTAPTETEQGYTTYTCANCGNSYVDNYTPALGLSYTVSFSVPAGVAAVGSLTGNSSGITLPTAGAPEGYTFEGWSEIAVQETTEIPTILTGTYVPTANTTLHAVYSREETVGGGGSTEYVLTDIANIKATDEVVVTMTYTDGTVYALSSANGTSKAPAATIITVSGDKLSAEPAADLIWNIGGSTGAYIFYPNGTTATWLYCTSTNNGVRVGTTAANTFAIDDTSGYLMHNGTGRYLGVYRTNPDWRCYTNTTGNTAGQTLGFYVKTGGSTTTTYYTTVFSTEPSVELTHISLVPHKDALGYKAAAYNLPDGAHVEISLWITENAVVTKATDTLRLVNILTCNGGETTINAKAAIVDAQGNVIVESATEQTTMRQAIEYVNDNYTNYNATQLAAVKELILAHEVAQTWNVENLLKEETEVDTAMVEIVNAAYALASGESMTTTSTLTGVITKVDTAYSSSFGNISVTIAVAGAEDKPILCYRLAGEGADQITIGDTITVTGTLKNYNGTIEFDAGCTLDSWVHTGEDVEKLTDPVEIVNAAYALEIGASLPYEVTLTGTITSVDTAYSADFGNVTVTITVAGAEGKPIQCYRLKGTGADTIAVGDTITVTGTLMNYNGTIEFTSGCTLG